MLTLGNLVNMFIIKSSMNVIFTCKIVSLLKFSPFSKFMGLHVYV